MVEYPGKYKRSIERLKEKGYDIIGYIRKSKGEEKDEVRVRLLNTMANRLRERSGVEKIFASPFTNSTDVMSERDASEKSATLLAQLTNIAGNTKGTCDHIG